MSRFFDYHVVYENDVPVYIDVEWNEKGAKIYFKGCVIEHHASEIDKKFSKRMFNHCWDMKKLKTVSDIQEYLRKEFMEIA